MKTEAKQIIRGLSVVCMAAVLLASFGQCTFIRSRDAAASSAAVRKSTGRISGVTADVHGIPLAYPVLREKEDAEAGEYRRVMHPAYCLAFANIIDGYAGTEGLDSVLSETLRLSSPTAVNDDDSIGRSVLLTLDAPLQNAAAVELEQEGITGSAVLMEPDGAVTVMVSSPSFDLNAYRTSSSFRLGETGSGHEQNRAVIALDAGMAVFAPFLCHLYGTEDVRSIGREAVLETLDSYFAFSDAAALRCDFAQLENSLTETEEGELRVSVSPAYLAAYTRECFFGEMPRPYAVSSYADTAAWQSVLDGNGGEKPSAPDEVSTFSAEDKLPASAVRPGEPVCIASVPEEEQAWLRGALLSNGDYEAAFRSAAAKNLPNITYEFFCRLVRTEERCFVYGGVISQSDPEQSKILVLEIEDTEAFGADDIARAGAVYGRILNLALVQQRT